MPPNASLSHSRRPAPKPITTHPPPRPDPATSGSSRPSSYASQLDSPYDSSFTSTTSTSPFLPVTPYNTFAQPDAFQDRSMLDTDLDVTPTSSQVAAASVRFEDRSSSDGEGLYESHLDRYGRPSIASSLPLSNTSSFASDIPFSSREIPRPPQSVHTTSTLSHSLSASSAAMPLISASASATAAGGGGADISTPSSRVSQLSTPPTTKFGLDLSSSSSRGSSKVPKQADVDTQRLQQLGYDAALGRDYTFWSSLSISWINIGALQGTIYAVSGAYSYGGPLMILVAWPIAGILCVFLNATMAELASAYPVAGAMASWAWKLARGGVGGERAWGWLLGGFVMGGHIGNLLLVVWELSNIIAGTMALSFDYQRQSWHLFLFFLAALLLCGTVGSRPWGRSHYFWLSAGVFTLAMWIVLCITLLATNATKARSGNMFTIFYNTTGWSSRPYVYLLGWEYTCIASGADASAHMAEETQNPSRNVPNAMTVSVIATYVLGYISIVLLLLAVKPEDAVNVKSHHFAFGYILTKAISKSGAVSICCLMVVVMLLQTIAQLQASSRFVFALARDNAMPFSDWVKKTNSHRIPVIANWLVITLCAPFACLTLASQSTLYSVLAVTASILSYAGYVVPVALYLFSNKDLQSEGRTSWSLRKWSKPVAAIGCLYALFVIISSTFPGSRPVTADTFSWSPAILVGTVLTCLLTWKCYGDRHYSGPIRAVTKWETGVELDLSTTLASSRSKHSGAAEGLGTDSQVKCPDLEGRETDSSLKLALEPHYPSSGVGMGMGMENSLVTVTSAQSGSSASTGTGEGGVGARMEMGEWSEVNDNDSGGGIMTSRSLSEGDGRVAQEDVEDGDSDGESDHSSSTVTRERG